MTDSHRTEAERLFHQGLGQLSANDLDSAENSFRRALDLSPDFFEAWANLAFALDQKQELAQAEACYRRALSIASRSSHTHLNLGTLLAAQGRSGEAEDCYREAIACSPESAAAWSNLGVLCIGLKRETEAEELLRKALALDPTFAKAQFNLAYLQLRQGRFEEGWQSLEARDWYRGLENHFECPRWRGESLSGKSLLIGYEAGHGDVIQFCRYATLLKDQGTARITLLCHPALKTLLATLAGVDQVLAFDQDVPRSGWDYWTPLLSLPYHCQTRADSIPAAIPYLHASADRMAKWGARLPLGKPRVGLVWKGNPKFDNDADRSIARLDLLAPLGAVPGLNFISLQKGAGEDEARQPPLGLALLHLGTDLEDFADAAAIVAQLDLLISVDTAMAHLAGALGTPCWLLLPDHMADWRWQSERNDSPWYPGRMRLFRQTRRGDWPGAIKSLKQALTSWANQAHA